MGVDIIKNWFLHEDIVLSATNELEEEFEKKYLEEFTSLVSALSTEYNGCPDKEVFLTKQLLSCIPRLKSLTERRANISEDKQVDLAVCNAHIDFNVALKSFCETQASQG